MQTHDGLLRSLGEGERGGVYFLYGDEEYLKDEGVSAIISAHLDPGTRDFNLDRLRGTETDAETLSSIMQTPPMMAEWRVVVVRDAQGLAGSSTSRAAVEAVLDRPLPGLALVLVATIPDRSRAKFYTTLKKRAVAVEYVRLDDADVPGWLMTRAGTDGLELEPAAARAMAAAIGPDLGTQVSELAKLREYVGDRDRITMADVDVVVGAVPRVNRWDWMDAVAEQRFDEARTSLPPLLESGETGVGLVIALGVHFLRLGLALTGGRARLEQALPPHQRWLARKYPGQARRWTGTALSGALDDLLRADRLLKSAPLSDLQIMDELLLRMQHRIVDAAA